MPIHTHIPTHNHAHTHTHTQRDLPAEHADYTEADALYAECGGPVLVQDVEADVSVAVHVRVHRYPRPHKHNLVFVSECAGARECVSECGHARVLGTMSDACVHVQAPG